MKFISFAHTSDWIRNRTKTVTRRTAWRDLKPGTLLQACVKYRGVAKDKRETLGTIRVVDVRREPLNAITADEIQREGFSNMTPENFVSFFCDLNGCQPHAEVTRIAFEYV